MLKHFSTWYKKYGLVPDALFWKVAGLTYVGLLGSFALIGPVAVLTMATLSAWGIPTLGDIIGVAISFVVFLLMITFVIITMRPTDEKETGMAYHSYYRSMRQRLQRGDMSLERRALLEEAIRSHEAYMEDALLGAYQLLRDFNPAVQVRYLYAQACRLYRYFKNKRSAA